MRVLTVGHSNQAFAAFRDLLLAHGVARLVDVRRYPRSRFVPWATREHLAAALPEAGVAYAHVADLGGHRAPAADSPNTGLTSDTFRGYADHAATAAFRTALDDLLDAAADTRTAVMCAEADPTRCHRRILSDALVTRGADVRHIVSATEARPHALHPRARVGADGRVTYPDPQTRLTTW